MQKKRKITKKALKSTLLWTLVAVLFTGYILYHFISGFAPAGATSVTIAASERFTLSFDSYIMRNETVLTSENTGFCDYIVGNTDYSKDEAELARVYSLADGETVKRIKAIDEEYAVIEACESKLSNVGTTMGNVTEAYKSIITELSSNDVKDVLPLLDALLSDMYALENSIGTDDTQEESHNALRTRLAELREEREQLCLSLGAYESIAAPGTGNFFHGIDGYESSYSSENVLDMTLEDFENMFGSSPEMTDGAIGTYMKDYTWYIAVPSKESEIVAFTSDSDGDGEPDSIGRKYSVSFKYTSGAVIDMTLERIVRGGSSEAVMIFSSATLPEGFDRTRHQTVEIEFAEYSGYRIANEAITNIDGEDGVWILKGGKVTRRRVEILVQNENYAIIKSQAALAAPYAADGNFELKRAELENTYPCLNDVYFLSDKGLYEGKLID